MAKRKQVDYLEKLVALISPPAKPVDAGPLSKRASVEEKLGLGIPDDYVAFALKYGSGSISTDGYSNVIAVINPFSPSYFKTLARHGKRHAGDQAKDKESNAYPYFPEPRGLLLCATGEADREVYYLTSGEPDQWPLFAMLVGFEFEQFKMSISEFLYKMFSGKLDASDKTRRLAFRLLIAN